MAFKSSLLFQDELSHSTFMVDVGVVLADVQ